MTKKPTEKIQPPVESIEPSTPLIAANAEPPVVPAQAPENGKLKKKKRPPRLTHKQVWLLYADVLRCTNPDQVFDILARTFASRSDLGYWLYRIRHGKKTSLGKKRDFVQYFRAVATSPL